jgi:hypothetical protein
MVFVEDGMGMMKKGGCVKAGGMNFSMAQAGQTVRGCFLRPMFLQNRRRANAHVLKRSTWIA